MQNGQEPAAEPAFGLYWPGKAAAFAAAQAAPSVALATRCQLGPPAPAASGPEHELWVGDNLQALALLRQRGDFAARLCYIDPPYNEGKDYLYRDRYGSAGRRHDAWLSMLAPRLLLARELLAANGILFVSIGDDAQAPLRLLGDEIFGDRNFVGCVPRITKRSSNKGRHFAPSKDYLLAWARNRQTLPPLYEAPDPARQRRFRGVDERGRYAKVGLFQHALDPRPNQRYWIRCPDGSFAIPPGDSLPAEVADAAQVRPQGPADRCWRWSVATYQQQRELLVFQRSRRSPLVTPAGTRSEWNIYTKYYLADREAAGTRPRDFLDGLGNHLGTAELRQLGLDDCFPFAKPVGLPQRLLAWIADPTAVVLDFFAGSGTTAAAVLRQNALDGGQRRCLLVQQPEPTGRYDYPTIAELTIERLRRELASGACGEARVHIRDLVPC